MLPHPTVLFWSPMTLMTSSAASCHCWLSSHTWSDAAKVSSHLCSSAELGSRWRRMRSTEHGVLRCIVPWTGRSLSVQRLQREMLYCSSFSSSSSIFTSLHHPPSHPSSISSVPPFSHFIPDIFQCVTRLIAELTQTTPDTPRASALSWGCDVNGRSGNSWWRNTTVKGAGFTYTAFYLQRQPCRENQACNAQHRRMVQAWGGGGGVGGVMLMLFQPQSCCYSHYVFMGFFLMRSKNVE